MNSTTTTLDPVQTKYRRHLLVQILDRFVEDARIRFYVGEDSFTVGRGDPAGHAYDVALRVHRPRFFARVVAGGNLGMGEAYMDGDFEMETGELADFLIILLRNRLDRKIRSHPATAARVLATRVRDQFRGKATNVQRHYDIGVPLFEAFLDKTLTYSCGYVGQPGDDLDQLQFNKLDRICRKLRLQPGDRLLDIGCGYGGLLIHAAKHYQVTGVGVTVSHDHCNHGNARIAEEGVADRVKIDYADFTTLEGRYNKVVSVGMLEHVPRREYGVYFRRIAAMLTTDGLGLVHAIGANADKNRHDPFFQKYIFPGSNQPRLSEIAAHLEARGLPILDVENMVRHYGYTVQGWLARFRANQDQLDPQQYDVTFRRMWEYYLHCGIAAAFASDSALYQVLFAKDYAAPIPLHRV